MDKRNKITLILVSLMLLGAVFATLVTIKDYDKIIQDINNYTGITAPNTGNNAAKANLLIYLVANTSTSTLNDFVLLSAPPTGEEIKSAIITITEIKLREKGTQHFTRILQNKEVDLKNFEQITLLTNTTIGEGNYTSLSLRLSQDIEIVTNKGTYSFSLQGSLELQTPFYKNYRNTGGHTQGELCAKHKANTPLLIDFHLVLNWFAKRANVQVGAYLDF